MIEIVAANLAVYEIALRLSKGNRAVAVWTAIIRALISVLCWNLGEVPGYYLWTRMAESKSMLANVYLPLALLAIVLAAEETEKKQCWIMLGVFAFCRGDDVDEWRVHDTDAFGCRTPPSAASQEEVKILGICGAVGAAVLWLPVC